MENERQSMPIVVTRNDLYRQVWSTPLVQLAARYKTTTAERTTMCTRMNVPRPPSGYWLKKIERQACDSERAAASGPKRPKLEYRHRQFGRLWGACRCFHLTGYRYHNFCHHNVP
jgi:hypothetical protein